MSETGPISERSPIRWRMISRVAANGIICSRHVPSTTDAPGRTNRATASPRGRSFSRPRWGESAPSRSGARRGARSSIRISGDFAMEPGMITHLLGGRGLLPYQGFHDQEHHESDDEKIEHRSEKIADPKLDGSDRHRRGPPVAARRQGADDRHDQIGDDGRDELLY